MRIFAISDLHLAGSADKTMDMFGEKWQEHWDKIKQDWLSKVTNDDVVLISGDVSWAMHLKDALEDLNVIAALPGKKIFIRGNHDYWWSSITKVRESIDKSMLPLQNDAVKIGNFVFAGTRGWMESGSADDKKIFAREMIRLDLTLSAAKRLMDENSTLIVLMHYPPQFSGTQFSSFCPVLEQYGAKICVYGHLHSFNRAEANIYEHNGVRYVLASCDMIDFNLREIKTDI